GYSPDKNWNLTGGSETLNNVGDVAYLMRALEDKSTEHIFAVAANSNTGENMVLHISSGDISSAAVDHSAIQQAVNAVSGDHLYFIHNHPSGNLKPSPADEREYKKINKYTGNRVIVHGIIMDTYKGLYSTFTDSPVPHQR